MGSRRMLSARRAAEALLMAECTARQVLYNPVVSSLDEVFKGLERELAALG
jgi:hypothetical protein